MNKDMIIKELIQLDWQVADQAEFFERMSTKLLDLGYVRPTFHAAITTREENYPTALPVQPEPVAIPHCDTEHIVKSFIACTRLAQPIKWLEMGTDDVVDHVRFIFMLGFTGHDGHVELLQILIQNFQESAFIDGLLSAKTVDEYYDIVKNMSGLED